MARSRGSFRSRATSLANNTRRAQRLRADERRAPRDLLRDVQEHDDESEVTHHIDNPLLAVDTSDQALPTFAASLPAPRGESPENDLANPQSKDETMQSDSSEETDIARDTLEEPEDRWILFGDFIDTNSSSDSSSSSSSGSSSSSFEPPKPDEQFAKLWDEESQTYSEYSQNGVRDDRPGTGNSIESSASALHRCQLEERQQSLAYAEQAQQQQQIFAFQQQQQHAFAMQLQTHHAQLMHACYYEEQNLVTPPQPRRPKHTQRKRKQQIRKQGQQLQEREPHAREQTRYNPQHRQRRQQEAGRRKQALQYLNQAEYRRDEGFLHPPLPSPFNLGFPNLISQPPFIPMMGGPMVNFIPQFQMAPMYPNDLAGASMPYSG